MARKFAHIIIAVFMLMASSGFTLYQHYCQGHLVSSSLLHPPPSCCGDDCDCCSNDQVTFQLDDNFLDVVFHFNWIDFGFEVPELVAFNLDLPEEDVEQVINVTAPDPPGTTQALAILQVYCL